MCSSALNSGGKPAVSPMSGGSTFDIEKKNRNGANLKLRHALRAGGVKSSTATCILYANQLAQSIKALDDFGGFAVIFRGF